MTPPKAVPAAGPKPASAAAPRTEPTTSTSGARKPWIKKTPIEVVLDQIGKQEQRVAEMREELAREERELKKLQQAKNVLEST